MEDFEKYVFDPDNPKGFKAYGLLKKIIKEQNTITIIDPLFSLTLFEEDFFTPSIISELWDKPNNYNELNIKEKKTVFINNFSSIELTELILKKIHILHKSFLKSFFKNFLTSIEDSPFEGIEFGWEINEDLYKEYFSLKKPNLLETIIKSSIINFINKFNQIYFLRDDFIHCLPKNIQRTSIIFLLLEDFKNPQELKLPKNLRPIYLNKIEDLELLLNFVRKDNNKKQNLNQNKKNSYPIKSCTILNYFSLKEIKLKKLEKKKEIYFLGENGDGKTLLLQAITLALKGNQNIGLVSDFIKQNETQEKLSLTGSDSQRNIYEFKENPKEQTSSYNSILAYGVNRFEPERIYNIEDEKDQSEYEFHSIFNRNEYLENPVNWLKYLDYKEKSGEFNAISLSKAIELLNNLLEKNVQIKVTPDSVLFYERGTKLKFKQLSDGYKSVLVWMCDLLSRLANKQPEVEHISEFHGIVLVDEIGMFLHPKWQRTIVKKLRITFPNIQFFFTTHSPIVLLGASEDAVFYKVYKEDGETKVSDPIENKSLGHLMANGIITAPFLFGLESARNEVDKDDNSILDTSDDYLTGKIHEAVSKKIATKNNISEDQIMDLIQKELDKYEAQAND